MKNKKGFTLIELLAVIVILAIIALIATPIVINMIENARKSAAKSSSLGFIDSVEYYAGFAQANDDGIDLEDYDSTLIPTTNTVCKKENGTWSTCAELMAKVEVKTKGKAPTDAQISIDTNGKVRNTSWLKYNDYYCVYNGLDIKDGCTKTTPADAEVENDTSSADSEYSSNESYIYSINPISSSSDGNTDKPSDKHVYFKYETENGEIVKGTVPETCINSDKFGGELCLKNNEFTESSKKIKEYFKWNDETNSSSYPGVTCSITDSSVGCNDDLVGNRTDSDGFVTSYDSSIKLSCYVFADGRFNNRWY